MGNGISSVGGPPPIIPNQQGGQPQAITNPTAQQLLELMAERPVVQQLQGQTAQGGAFITLGNQQGTDLNVQFVPQGTPLPAQPDVTLHNVQAVATDGHAVIDPQTNYVLTDPFTGCSFFMLAINGQDTVFHVQEQMPGQPLLARLAPFMTVADAIRAQHPDQTLTPLVDAYLDQHPHQEVTALKGQDPHNTCVAAWRSWSWKTSRPWRATRSRKRSTPRATTTRPSPRAAATAGSARGRPCSSASRGSG